MASQCRAWVTVYSRCRLKRQNGFRDFADPNYLRRILGMFDLK